MAVAPHTHSGTTHKRGTMITLRAARTTALAAGTLALSLGGASAAQAATASDGFLVTTTVAPAATVTAADLAFGSYVASALAPTTGSSAASVQATKTTTYTLAFNDGLNAVASQKRMSNPAPDFLNYSLSLSAAGGTGNGTAQPFTINGSIPAGQFVTPGAYSDSVVLTATF